MLLAEIVRHVRPGHQVEPGEFHGYFSSVIPTGAKRSGGTSSCEDKAPRRRSGRRVAIFATRRYGGAGEHDTPCKTASSIFTATPRPSPRPACQRPWATPT